ncbi:MAG: hypothetical protein AAGA80_15310 [Cyanobacteria bacterium P01_F01_bin.143]
MFLRIFPKLEKVTYFIILFSFLGGIYNLQKEHHNKTQQKIEARNYAEQIESSQVSLNTQKLIPTFGFNNLRADLTYLQFVQYFGDEEARKQTGYALVHNYFETVNNYDPNFTQANLMFSVANSMYAGQPEKTVAMMEKVLQSSSPDLGDTYLIWFAKGLDELLFLGDNQAALNSHYNSTKSVINRENIDLNDFTIRKITQANQGKIKYLATNPDTTEAQILAWKSVLPNVVDPINHQRISDRITVLEQNLNYQATSK